MSNDIIPAQESAIKAVDSLVANEFVLEINDQPVDGIFRVSGLITFKLEVKATNALKRVHDPFRITKMVQRDPHNLFNVWLRETLTADADILRPLRQLTLIAVDDSVPIRRWSVNKAWISEVSYSDFDSGSAAMIEETVIIQHDGIEVSWPLLEG